MDLLNTIAVSFACFLVVISAIDYVRRASKHETDPVLVTFILMALNMGLAAWMYWTNPRKSFDGNIGVTGGIVNVLTILIGLIVVKKRDGTLAKLTFTRFQIGCIQASGLVFLIWLLTNEPLIAYSLVQCIALIAYAATAKRLWSAPKITEPLFFWVCIFLANLSAIVPAYVKRDPFSYIYLGRAIPSTAFMLYLILRIKRRMKSTPA